MKLIRSLGMLVLLGSVSWMLGCSAKENTSGPSGGGGGSGVAGGAVVPHAHEGEAAHAHEGDAQKAEEPKTEAPAADAEKTAEPKADAAPKSE